LNPATFSPEITLNVDKVGQQAMNFRHLVKPTYEDKETGLISEPSSPLSTPQRKANNDADHASYPRQNCKTLASCSATNNFVTNIDVEGGN
jgi:hypothetical protein